MVASKETYYNPQGLARDLGTVRLRPRANLDIDARQHWSGRALSSGHGALLRMGARAYPERAGPRQLTAFGPRIWGPSLHCNA